MFWKNKFADQSFLVKLLFLTGASIALASAVMLVYTVVAVLVTGSPAAMMSTPFLKGSLWIQSFFAFILPSLLMAYLFSPSVSGYLYLNGGIKLKMMFLCLIAYILYAPVLNLIVQWNEQLQLPGFLSGVEAWMKESEEASKNVMDKILETESVTGLLMNILLIGVMAGVSEEFLFRGTLQRLVFDRFKNVHLAVWSAAVVFSAIHFQFYGFFPRLLMGAFFGYALVWTGSLYIPMALHVFNNTAVLITKYLEQKGIVVLAEYESIGTTPDTYVYLIAYTFFAVILTVVVYKRGTRYFKYGQG